MRPWSEVACDWLADYYALATVVLLAAVAMMGVLRQPARRLSVAWSAVVGLAALALLGALPGWPRAGWSFLPARQGPARPPIVAGQGPPVTAPIPYDAGRERPAVTLPVVRGGSPAPARVEMVRGETISRRPAAREAAGGAAAVALPDGPTLAGRAFLTGVGAMLAWLGIGSWQTAAVRRRSRRAPRPAEEALARVVGDGQAPPGLLVSGRLVQPVAVGLLRPTIILPDRLLDGEPGRRLEAALAHEWAHIRNRDLWLIALTRLLMPVLFAHPAYWWLRRRVRDDQEALADAEAAAGARVDYAEILLSWALGSPERPRLAVAGSLALWERPSQLKRRIVMLLDRDFRVETTCPRAWRLGVRGGTALSVLALSVLTFRPAAVGADPPGAPDAPKAAPASGKDPAAGELIRVLDPDGKPAEGARVFRSDTTDHSLDHEPGTAPLLTRTGPDGTFRLSPGEAKDALDRRAQYVVKAERCGPAFTDPSVGDGMKEIRLARDDVPIRGRVLDIQGRPVAGASVQLVGILWHPSGKLDEWLAALEEEKVAYPVQYRMLRWWMSDDIPSLYPAVATDREGRFTLEGVGRERVASLLIGGAGVETRFEFVATREMPAVKFPDFDRQNQGRTITYHGASFDLVAGPGLEVTGTVRDKDTGKPLAGAVVQTTAAFGNPLRFLRATADAEGRYRLSGIPPKTSFGDEQDLLASVKGGAPYVPSVQRVGEGRGPGPITRDFALKRGAWARGRVTDKLTGKPIRASLGYYILADNPHLKDYPPYGTIRVGMPFQADENGEYKIVVMPGRGALGARFGNDTYRLGAGIDKIRGVKVDPSGMVPARPSYLMTKNYNMVVGIDPKEGDESVTADIALDRGRTLKGTLVGPGGEPVAGALMMGAEDHFQMWSHQPLPKAEFEVHSLGSEDKRGLLFYHEGKKLAGAYVVKPDEQGPVTITLEPCGTLAGRLVDDGGLPQAGVQMTCDRPYEGEDARYEKGSLPAPIKTDKDGRFRASGLVPGLKYSLRVWKGRMIAGEAAKDVVTKAGEDKDLGDVKVGD